MLALEQSHGFSACSQAHEEGFPELTGEIQQEQLVCISELWHLYAKIMMTLLGEEGEGWLSQLTKEV